ncbi:hypothetical protein [Holdemania sp. Marseille-P2844]|uniref:hypothetical protein n=1 Tax=Holdemania sp. Marseille-P2844 TaxID=1852366 RepID=UPI000A6AA9AD|nr:hypothetical protein [Holdemania sp. Marseille-P2844]
MAGSGSLTIEENPSKPDQGQSLKFHIQESRRNPMPLVPSVQQRFAGIWLFLSARMESKAMFKLMKIIL